jgi:GNAT superfamily N-acetyltransferase
MIATKMTHETAIRAALAGDVEPVRLLLRATWHDTYDAIIGRDRVIALTEQWHAPAKLRNQISASDHVFLVAHRGETLVGHACSTRYSHELLYLGRLYVLPAAQRCGIGHRLLAAILDRSPGVRRVRAKVEAANAKARNFYRREGFTDAGEVLEDGLRSIWIEKAL